MSNSVESENGRKGCENLGDLSMEFMEDKAVKIGKVQLTALNTKTQSFHLRNLCCQIWAMHPWPWLWGMGAIVGFEQNAIKKRDVLR